jgi:hypothetical protein
MYIFDIIWSLLRWLSYSIDIIWEVLKWLWQNRNKSFTFAAFTSLLFIIVDKAGRKLITNQLKRLFHAQDKSEFAQYKANQLIIMENQRLMMEHMGVKGCVERNDLSQNSGRPLLKFSIREKLFARIAAVFTQKELTIYSRRNKTMKSYLGKLSSTKLQALIVASIMNVALLVGYVMDVQDIQSKVDAWMPMANLLVQTILTIAYQWTRASVDKAEIKAITPKVSQYDIASLDATRKESEGI